MLPRRASRIEFRRYHKGVESENQKRSAHGQTRFLLLSTQRSGTHYIMHELRRHPQIFTYDEIFYKRAPGSALARAVDRGRRHSNHNNYIPGWGPREFRRGIDIFYGVNKYEPNMIDARRAVSRNRSALDTHARRDARRGRVRRLAAARAEEGDEGSPRRAPRRRVAA